MQKALFGAGCFWGIEEYFRKIPGVKDTKVGYSGGYSKKPTYETVCGGTTEHVEVLQLDFDDNEISLNSRNIWRSNRSGFPDNSIPICGL